MDKIQLLLSWSTELSQEQPDVAAFVRTGFGGGATYICLQNK